MQRQRSNNKSNNKSNQFPTPNKLQSNAKSRSKTPLKTNQKSTSKFPNEKTSPTKSTRSKSGNKKIKKREDNEIRAEKTIKFQINNNSIKVATFSRKGQKQYSFGKQERQLNLANTNHELGPGSYNYNQGFIERKEHSQQFSKLGRQEIKQDHVPGPGSYQYDVGNVRANSPSYQIEGKAKQEKHKDVPGPGKYEIPTTIGKEKQVNFRQGQRSPVHYSHQISNPGFDKYNPSPDQKYQSKQGHTFSRSPKGLQYKSDNQLGPGSYNTAGDLKEQGKNILFPKEKKADILHRNYKNPGPGAYETQDYGVLYNPNIL